MTPEETCARESIRRTQSAYHLAGDRGRLDEMVATFAEDGVLELATGPLQGRQAIREGMGGVRPTPEAGSAQPPAFLRHHLTTSYIELIGPTTAQAWSYFLVMSPIGVDHSGRYVDEYVAEAGQWLIARRRVVVEWAAEDSVIGARVTPRAKAG